MFKRLASVEDMLTEMKVDITFAWIQSHQGIEFNETEDFIAKETACAIYKGWLSAPTIVTYNDAVRMSTEIARTSWQRKWDQDVSGFYTRQLIPKFGVKVSFTEKRECSFEREFSEHFLLCCSRYLQARNQFKDTLNDISDASSCKKHLHLSENLLLAPLWDSVTRNQDKIIKEALFQFIAETSETLI